MRLTTNDRADAPRPGEGARRYAGDVATLWTAEDEPVLKAINRLAADREMVNFHDVVEAVGGEESSVARSFERLEDARLIKGIDARTFDGFDMLDVRLTDRGLTAVGEWPDLAHRVEVLAEQAATLDATELRRRIAELGDTARSFDESPGDVRPESP